MSLLINYDENSKQCTLQMGTQKYAGRTAAELLNPLGADGWELVSFIGDWWTGYMGGYSNKGYMAMLKRRFS